MTGWFHIVGWDRFRPGSTRLYLNIGRKPWFGTYEDATNLAATLTTQRAEGLCWRPIPTTEDHHDYQSRRRADRGARPTGPPDGW